MGASFAADPPSFHAKEHRRAATAPSGVPGGDGSAPGLTITGGCRDEHCPAVPPPRDQEGPYAASPAASGWLPGTSGMAVTGRRSGGCEAQALPAGQGRAAAGWADVVAIRGAAHGPGLAAGGTSPPGMAPPEPDIPTAARQRPSDVAAARAGLLLRRHRLGHGGAAPAPASCRAGSWRRAMPGTTPPRPLLRVAQRSRWRRGIPSQNGSPRSSWASATPSGGPARLSGLMGTACEPAGASSVTATMGKEGSRLRLGRACGRGPACGTAAPRASAGWRRRRNRVLHPCLAKPASIAVCRRPSQAALPVAAPPRGPAPADAPPRPLPASLRSFRRTRRRRSGWRGGRLKVDASDAIGDGPRSCRHRTAPFLATGAVGRQTQPGGQEAGPTAPRPVWGLQAGHRAGMAVPADERRPGFRLLHPPGDRPRRTRHPAVMHAALGLARWLSRCPAAACAGAGRPILACGRRAQAAVRLSAQAWNGATGVDD